MSETCFIGLGIGKLLQQCCHKKGWLSPTEIQSSAIPRVIEGCDVVGLSETGSGKTVQLWLRLDKPKGYALILLPTRELAKQIFDELQCFASFIKEIDKDILMNCICLIGGEEMISQKLVLARDIQHFIIDEADLMLNMQFREALDDILKMYEKPMSKRKDKRKTVNLSNQIEKFPHPQTHLYSATMTKDVQKLRRAALRFDAAYVYGLSTDDNVKLPKNLCQFFIPVQILDKHIVLDYIIEQYSKKNENRGEKSFSNFNYKIIVFCNRINESNRIGAFLKERGYSVHILTGKTPQESRSKAFKNFSSEGFSILVCTDVASRGLDFKNIGLVINYEVPVSEKCYRHRIGRTARAGERGESLTLVSRDCATTFLDIESQLAKVMSSDGTWCMPKWPECKVVENSSLLKKQRLICEPVWRSANKCIRDMKEQRYQKKRELIVCEGEVLSDLSDDDYSSLSDSDATDDSTDSNEKKDYITGKSGIEAANRQYRSLKKDRKRKRLEKELQCKKHNQEYADILKKDDDDVDKGHLSFKPTISDKIAKLC